ncbi:MAG: menaquinol-cytochrome C reductase, partial [Mycobacteriaceae bacterium]
MSERSDAEPTTDELAAMSRDELVTLGLKEDDVELAYRRERWPIKGTKAEKRAER